MTWRFSPPWRGIAAPPLPICYESTKRANTKFRRIQRNTSFFTHFRITRILRRRRWPPWRIDKRNRSGFGWESTQAPLLKFFPCLPTIPNRWFGRGLRSTPALPKNYCKNFLVTATRRFDPMPSPTCVAEGGPTDRSMRLIPKRLHSKVWPSWDAVRLPGICKRSMKSRSNTDSSTKELTT